MSPAIYVSTKVGLCEHSRPRLTGIVLAAFLLILGSNSRAETYLSPHALLADRDGKTLFVAELTAGKVVRVDPATGAVAAEVRVSNPSALALSPDGAHLYVAAADPAGSVSIIDIKRFKTVKSIAVGHTPSSLAVSADGSTLYVGNKFNNNVSVVDLKAGKELRKIPVSRQPVAMALSLDGKRLLVANLLPDMPANADYVAATVTFIDTTTGSVLSHAALPNGSTALRGLCLSPDGKYAYVTHTLARYQLPTTQLDRGWMNTSAVTILDVASAKPFATFLLDDVSMGAANPWGVACTADGSQLCVAHAGTHEVSVIDRTALHAKLDRLAASQKATESTASLGDVANDLSFLVEIRRRIKLGGNGPRGLATYGNTIAVAEYFTGSLGLITLSTNTPPVVREVSLGDTRKLTEERRGEMYFHDAQFCFQQWQSCTSCHPDSRVDGFNWDLLNDGIGNPKNTKNMLLCFQTPPSMSLAIRHDAQIAVRAGLMYIQFAMRPEADAKAIDAYLTAMKPVPSPYLVKGWFGTTGRLSASARRGQRLFKDSGCAVCHPAPLYASLKAYEVGTTDGMDKGKPVDTPTLIEAWRTAPYLHDGSARTVTDAFLRCSQGKECGGGASKLTGKQKADLTEFVLSQ